MTTENIVAKLKEIPVVKNVDKRYARHFWVDTETTGLDYRNSFVFQMSYFIEEKGEIILSRKLEMRPDNYDDFVFDAKAEEVHSWSKEKIAALMPETEGFNLLLNDIEPFSKDKLTVCGYNIGFDIDFIKQLFCRNTGKSGLFYKYFEPMSFDVLQFAQGLRMANLLNLPNLQLETVCTHFAISTEGAHDSMTDILNTYEVFKKLFYLERKAELGFNLT